MNGQSRRKYRGAAAMLLAAGMSIAPHAAAQGGEANTGRFYAFVGPAAFLPQKNGDLQGERGNFVAGMVGGGYRLTPSLAVELGGLFGIRTLDTPPTAQPPAGTFNADSLDSSMVTAGVNATAKFSFAVNRFAPYFGGGLGWYTTGFQTTSESPSCAQNCSDTGPRVRGRSRDVGYHALVGADFSITAKDLVAVEVRYLKLEAEFGDILPGKVDAGGTFFWLGYRRYF